jgi:hypothetical protein
MAAPDSFCRHAGPKLAEQRISEFAWSINGPLAQALNLAVPSARAGLQGKG